MYIDTLSRKILRELCTNSRQTVTELATKFNTSRYLISKRIEALEQELGLHYTIEVDPHLLGITGIHVIHADFDKKPPISELAEALGKSTTVQFAATTKGQFDLLMITASKSLSDYFQWEINLWLRFAKYGITTVSSELLLKHLGFLPFTKELILDAPIKPVFRNIMAELNDNARISIRELSKRLGLNENLTRYYFTKLEKSHMISKYTATITKPPTKYNIVFFVNYRVREGVIDRIKKEREEMYWKEPEEMPIVNEFQEMLSLTGGHSAFIWATYDDLKKGMEQSIGLHQKIYAKDSPKVVYAIIDKVIKGTMPIRNIDTKAEYDRTLNEKELI